MAPLILQPQSKNYGDLARMMLATHLDGAFLTTRAALRQMYKQNGGGIIYMGSVDSKEASLLRAP